MTVATDPGTILAVILTLCVYSYYTGTKQNVFFRFAQSTIVGAGLGYVIVIVMLKNLDNLAFTPIMKGNWVYLLPVALGLLMYARFVPGKQYLARTPIALIVSVGIGLGARAGLETDVITMVIATVNLPMVGVDPWTAFSNLVLFIGVVTASAYFFFTVTPKMAKKMQPITTIGRYYLMIYFGARFASTIMSRVSLFLSRAQFILYDFLGLG